MKKAFVFILLLFSLFAALSAQTSSVAGSVNGDINEQYETFSWSPVAKAKEYGLTIQKLDISTEEWTDFKEVKTKETTLEVLFSPGSYRVSICVYNFIGRKSKPSDWVQFQILEENVPYLNEKLLTRHSFWQVPVINLNQASTQALDSDNASQFISPENDFGQNTILVKGRNIFSPNTEFYLIPKDEVEGKAFTNWSDERGEQKLNILYRNSKEYSVIVSYDPSALRPGYYALEARNLGIYKDDIDILVLDNSTFQISPDKGFEIDSHYSVNSILLSNSPDYEISIEGKGLNSSMEFYFAPAAGPYAYPFESQMNRVLTPLQVKNAAKKGDSTGEVTLLCNTDELRTGYYNLVAKDWDGRTSKILCLVKNPFANDYTKSIKKIKSKFNKRTEYVDFTIQDERLSAYKTYTLVSEYDSTTDSNNRVPLHLSSNGKKLTGNLSPSQLSFGKYALMIEDEYSSDVLYCTIDNTLKISTSKMTDAVIEKTFFRTPKNNAEVTLDSDDAGAIQFSDSKIEMKKYMPPLFSNVRFDLTLLEDYGRVFDFELDLLNFKYVALSLGYELQSIEDDLNHGIFSILRVKSDNEYFAPYLGLGIGLNLEAPEAGIQSFDDALGMFKNKNQYYATAQLGLRLLTIFDVRYNLFYNNMLSSSPYFSESISFGTTFPIRAYKFNRKVLSQSAQITKAGSMNVTNFIQTDSNIDSVIILQSSSIAGFEGFTKLEKVNIDASVQIIEENTFRNCENLNSVFFEERYNTEALPLTIKTNAFANDNMIDAIYLPYRTAVVQAGAFANWSDGQNIILCWNADDEIQRDLTGLMNCPASVHYENGELFNGVFDTPLDDERNWIPVNNLKFENVSILQDNKYLLGMRLKGRGEKWYKTELDTWINQDSPASVTGFLKGGDELSLMVQGDGNKYNLIITTQDGGYFYYTFKTDAKNLIRVEAPYKKFKKYAYSSQKKLDVNNIKMFCIMPMCNGEWNDVSFFDFEVKK